MSSRMRSVPTGTQFTTRMNGSFWRYLIVSGDACVPYSVSETCRLSCSTKKGGGDAIGSTRSTHSAAGTTDIGPTVRCGVGYPAVSDLMLDESTHISSCE